MNIFLKILLFYLPLIIVTAVFIIQNRQIKWYFWIIAIVSGMIAIIPSVLIQFFMPEIFNFKKAFGQEFYKVMFLLLLNCILINGIIEETCKSACIMMIMPRKFSLKQFFVLSILSGLSFGTFENVVYIIAGTKNPELRLFTSLLTHTACCAMDSFFIWFCWQKKCKIIPFITSILVHGLFNFFASMPGKIWFFSFAVILFGIFQCSLFYQTYINNDSENEPAQKNEPAKINRPDSK